MEVQRLDTGLQRDVMHAGEELLERDAQVEPGEVGSRAAMGSGSEREVAIARARRVEGRGGVELVRVAVGRRPVDHDLFTLLDLPAADLRVAHGGATDRDERWFEAQQLFDRAGQELGSTAEDIGDVGLSGEADHDLAERAGRCLQPSEDEELDHPDDLLVGDGPAFDVGRKDRVDDIAAGWLRPPRRDELADPPEHPGRGVRARPGWWGWTPPPLSR